MRSFALCLLLGACVFDPPASQPHPIGSNCSVDRDCTSGHCGPNATCVVCRAPADCGRGQTCDGSNQCVPEATGAHPVEPPGVVQTDAVGRRHIGQVAVIPVSNDLARTNP